MAKTVLIVDDSRTIIMSVQMILETMGLIVDSASDGLKALTKLQTGLKPDLIITDINMPNMDGIALIKAVRGLPGFRFTPILTLTTESQPEKKDQGRQAGATGWMVKPVTGPDLAKVVKQVLPGA